jgi:menaquinone reductase, molybdopterin-binding-like subunit
MKRARSTHNLQRTEYMEFYVRPPEEGLSGDHLGVASVCRQCSAGCGILVRARNGRARKIEGDPSYLVNQGVL